MGVLPASGAWLGVSDRGDTLLGLARMAIEAPLLGLRPRDPRPVPAWLEAKAATFVTLERQGALRGCIGTLEPHRPLVDDVRANAQAASFDDSRFAPLEAAELEDLTLEVSLLSPRERLPAATEAEVCAALAPGRDGVVLRWRGRCATFLPQVWAHLAEPARFLAQLKIKAGLPADFWHPEVEIECYGVESWLAEGLGAESIEP